MVKRGIIFIFAISLILTGCSKKSESNEKKVEDYSASKKEAVLEKDDGWYYMLSLTESNDSDNISSFYTFEGYNLKYLSLKGYDNSVKDAFGKKTDGKNLISLQLSEKESKDAEKINEYLNSKKFDKKISESDIPDLAIEGISKSDVVTLFNNLLDKNMIELGKNQSDFIYIPYAGVYSQKVNDKENVQFMYYYSVDHLEIVSIDISYSDNSLLSDLVNESKATAEQKEIYTNIQKIQEYIKDKETLSVKDEFSNLTGNEYDALFKLLNVVQTEIESTKKSES